MQLAPASLLSRQVLAALGLHHHSSCCSFLPAGEWTSVLHLSSKSGTEVLTPHTTLLTLVLHHCALTRSLHRSQGNPPVPPPHPRTLASSMWGPTYVLWAVAHSRSCRQGGAIAMEVQSCSRRAQAHMQGGLAGSTLAKAWGWFRSSWYPSCSPLMSTASAPTRFCKCECVMPSSSHSDCSAAHSAGRWAPSCSSSAINPADASMSLGQAQILHCQCLDKLLASFNNSE